MNRYAILDSKSIVTNLVVGEFALNGNWAIAPDEVQIGWQYEGNGDWTPSIEPLNVFLKNLSVKANGAAAQFFAGNYYANPKDSVELKADLVDGSGQLQAGISFPITLKMPVVRHANGVATTDEVYMNFTIVGGKATATVEIERSGDWKLLIDRLNVALNRMFISVNAPPAQRFVVKADDITIIA